MLNIDLTQRSILVTGASGGLGRAVCQILLDAGAHLTASDIDLGDLPTSLGNPERAQFIRSDVTRPDDVDTLVHQADTFADTPLWGLVNIVGAYTGGTPLHETSPEDLDRMLTLNTRTAYLCTRAATRRFLARDPAAGRVVSISAASADRADAGHFPYTAAKSAVLKLTESAANDYAGTHITFNAIQPGAIRTDANLKAMPDADHDAWVTPREIAHAIAFLLSPLASGVNGSAIRLTGRT